MGTKSLLVIDKSSRPPAVLTSKNGGNNSPMPPGPPVHTELGNLGGGGAPFVSPSKSSYPVRPTAFEDGEGLKHPSPVKVVGQFSDGGFKPSPSPTKQGAEVTWEEPQEASGATTLGTFVDYHDFHDAAFSGGGGGSSRGAAPRLTKPGYSTRPALTQLERMASNGHDISAVHDFAIYREGVGSIRWLKPVDLRDVDLDEDVAIEQGFASVYENAETASAGSNDDGDAPKPGVGQKLNVPALVTLEKVFPSKPSHMATEAKRKAYEEKVQKKTEAMGLEFVGYSIDTGVWEFKTEKW